MWDSNLRPVRSASRSAGGASFRGEDSSGTSVIDDEEGTTPSVAASRALSAPQSPGSGIWRPSLETISLASGSEDPKEDMVKKSLSKMLVNFRDVNLSLSMAPLSPEELLANADSFDLSSLPTEVQKNKLIIIMVGLPGRGKTFLCNKLKAYLNWLGHHTHHFNVGQYRRTQKGHDDVQDATFFDAHNEAGLEARQKALQAALDDLTSYLESDLGQVAIFDATNTTSQRRQLLRDTFHGKFQYLFIETVCNDESVLENNYRNKMLYSPDYTGLDDEQMDCAQGLLDFKARIRKYEEVYEPIIDRNLHFIKLIDMVTGRGYMDINRISGYIPGKIVFFCMQVCKAGLGTTRKIWLTRHGESMYNQKGLVGGDSKLSPNGEQYASKLPAALVARLPQKATEIQVSVWTSTLRRTIDTARQLPYPKLRWKALDEIDAGTCDGLTYEQISERFPHEYEARKADKLRYRYPSGESYLDVIQRVEPAVIEVERERECICIVAHQAVLRCMYGYFMNIDQALVPSVDIPLHTLIELTPMPDGTMTEVRIPIDVPGVQH